MHLTAVLDRVLIINPIPLLSTGGLFACSHPRLPALFTGAKAEQHFNGKTDTIQGTLDQCAAQCTRTPKCVAFSWKISIREGRHGVRFQVGAQFSLEDFYAIAHLRSVYSAEGDRVHGYCSRIAIQSNTFSVWT
jgi:hypothetical protein